jgi:chromosome partitioning protein
MSIISIANHKGGVGKTTTTINLAAGLALEGYRVLVLDLDPQSNATFSLGFKKQEKSIFNVLAFDEPIRTVIQSNDLLDIIPSSIHLAGFEKNNDVGKEFILTENLEDIRDEYDFILIDCPPSLGALTISALTASQYAIIALQPEFLAIQGMADFVKILRTVKTRMNKELELLGILINQYDYRKVLHREIMEHTRGAYGETVFDTTIRGNIALAEAQSMGQDIFTYDASCNGAEDYARLTREVVKRMGELVA